MSGEWKRIRPFSKGEYRSKEYGVIKRNAKDRSEWKHTAPNSRITYHNSLEEARKWAYSRDWETAREKSASSILVSGKVPTVTSILEEVQEKLSRGEVPEGWTKEEAEWANRLAEKSALRTDITERIHTQLKARRTEVAEMLRICANELENVALYPTRPHLGSHLAADIVRKIYNKIKEE